ncbi:hypothetical protein [Ammoniphilus sp. YIM 78166]|uniref:hypothetical protein n=1 Tax=Ammoniphilus sp. YIM 78166 TaxID=1644106 RepID=UPI00106F7574|nr:hypothetical protein [Ammoniphilus sp. YIM 78166]
MSVKIFFKGLSIERLSGSSGVFSGQNKHINWRSYSKRNDGFGSLEGQDNSVEQNHSVVSDKDTVDVYQAHPERR